MTGREWKYLEPHPQSSYKQLFIKGTRIRAEIIAGEMEDGEPDDPVTPEEIAAYRNLPIEAVREAIAYCESNPPEIEEDHRSDREHMQELGVIDAEGNYLRGTLPHLPPERPQAKMMLYLDDDSVAAALIQALRQAGHDIRTPAEAGLMGVHDALHLRQAIREGRSLLSRNYKDFEPMNFLVHESKGRHSGILMIRQDDPKKRKMKAHAIVRALRKLEAAGVPIANEYIVLNHWQ